MRRRARAADVAATLDAVAERLDAVAERLDAVAERLDAVADTLATASERAAERVRMHFSLALARSVSKLTKDFVFRARGS
jgi:uncharacterized membrane protein